MSSLKLQTHRLLIRDLIISDLNDFFQYRSDAEVTRYQGFDVFTMDEARSFIEDNATKTFGVPGEWVQFGIEEISAGKLIGDCAMKLDKYDSRIGEIGITISPSAQKKGYAKEALKALVDFLFAREDFHRVTETVDAENIASIRLLESVGFREEGHFIENIFFKGKWGSEKQFAILRREWLNGAVV